jgi:hypothetical protein
MVSYKTFQGIFNSRGSSSNWEILFELSLCALGRPRWDKKNLDRIRFISSSLESSDYFTRIIA